MSRELSVKHNMVDNDDDIINNFHNFHNFPCVILVCLLYCLRLTSFFFLVRDFCRSRCTQNKYLTLPLPFLLSPPTILSLKQMTVI